MNINIEASWLEILKDEFEKDYMKEIKSFLVQQIEAGKTIYPNPKNIFKAFDKTPFDKVKVVILGQDPYH
jgi:uracil-DNA glycosylase